MQQYDAEGFAPNNGVGNRLTSPLHSYKKSIKNPSPTILSPPSRNFQTEIFQSKGDQRDIAVVDGTGRGLAIFAVVLTICVWLFSIPPEFRRAHFCVVEECVQERTKCYDCVTLSEWTTGIQEYYKNGGGIEFDFTVAEETKAFWKDAVLK